MATRTAVAPPPIEDLPTRLPAVTQQAYQRGRDARGTTPRSSLGAHQPATERPDPVGILQAQEASRVPELVPIRYGRMLASPLTFLRGAAAVMAWDLGHAPSSPLAVQCCGDAHLGNFGFFAAPDRRLVFDVNDFDETLPAPFEWDVKRLAASAVVTGRVNGLAPRAEEALAVAVARSYREWTDRFARMRHLDVWYARVAGEDLLAALENAGAGRRRRAGQIISKAEQRTNLGALARFARRTPEGWRIQEEPPLIVRPRVPDGVNPTAVVRRALAEYLSTVPPDRARLIARYRYADAARKVVGVGSVGTEAYIALLIGDRDDDPLFLQLKEATTSVLAPHAGPSEFSNQGRRVVEGQRLMQAAGDPFLGWLDGTRPRGLDFYVRQLRDMKGSVEVTTLRPAELQQYVELCAGVLARAHARAGEPAGVAGYLGRGEGFDRAIERFATAYADQTESDWAALRQAVRDGRVVAETGV
jgi:uncharacterized protein (DUF2252 family)